MSQYRKESGQSVRSMVKALYLALPLALVVVCAILPLPLPWAMGGMLLGLLLFQLALVGAFDRMLPNQRRYLALRAETDGLLALVRELNAAVIDASRVGANPEPHTEPILQRMHETVDRLPRVAGRPAELEQHGQHGQQSQNGHHGQHDAGLETQVH